ncbi:MAG: excalibur calcium-binding domain-containing protein [Rhizobiaceae bacterium]|nr:excalibur calcium-binding domain-containing protein [Rhizobiaceae bacterium]
MDKVFMGAAMLAALTCMPSNRANASPESWSSADTGSVVVAQRASSCKQVRSCREAVEIWCGGYSRADADKDGIPCENICHSREEVDQIREEIGC